MEIFYFILIPVRLLPAVTSELPLLGSIKFLIVLHTKNVKKEVGSKIIILLFLFYFILCIYFLFCHPAERTKLFALTKKIIRFYSVIL